MEINLNQHPIDLFASWFEEAKRFEINDPQAMSFSSVSEDGYPSIRMVLLQKFDKRGFVFFTNYNSRKAKEIEINAKGAVCFHWKSIRKQVQAIGRIEKVSDNESDEYYFSRPLGSQIGAWASRQSEHLESREKLMKKVQKYEKKFIDKPPRPSFWGGFRLVPQEMEFWSDGKFRLHDRFNFKLVEEEWEINRLYP